MTFFQKYLPNVVSNLTPIVYYLAIDSFFHRPAIRLGVGAPRLHTITERVLDELSFDAPERKGIT